jgi:hypothetical protein
MAIWVWGQVLKYKFSIAMLDFNGNAGEVYDDVSLLVEVRSAMH